MHVYVYSLVIRSIRPPRRGGERDRVESVCKILSPLVSRARARAIHRRGVGRREMGLLSIIKKVRRAPPSRRRRAPARAPSFVR